MKWRPLIVLSLAQFLMVLDQAVMNVSISQLVEDFDTSVTVRLPACSSWLTTDLDT